MATAGAIGSTESVAEEAATEQQHNGAVVEATVKTELPPESVRNVQDPPNMGSTDDADAEAARLGYVVLGGNAVSNRSDTRHIPTTTAFGGSIAGGGGLFGSTKPSGGNSIFGMTAAFQPKSTASDTLFGAQQSKTGLFGRQEPAFGFGHSTQVGSSLFDQKKPSSSGIFGGAALNGPFGSKTTTASNLFGQPSQPASFFGFGQQEKQHHQAGTGLFEFGATKPAATQFGGFNTTQTVATDTQTGGLFGAAPTNAGRPGSIFGGQQQQTTGGLFGQLPETGPRFVPPTGEDVMQLRGNPTKVNTKHMCISAMPVYERKSFEELRHEDYTAGRAKKSDAPPSGGTTSPFGHPKPQPLFGNRAPETGPFGGKPKNPSGFTCTFIPAATTFTPMFGPPQTITTGGGLFGNRPSGTTGPFGVPGPFTSIFRTPPTTTTTTGGGLFDNRPSGTGPFGVPATSPFTPIFRTPQTTTTTTTGGGLFDNRPVGASLGAGAATQPVPVGGSNFPPSGATSPQNPQTASGQTTNRVLFGQSAPATGNLLGGGASTPNACGTTVTITTEGIGRQQAAPALGQPANGGASTFGQPAHLGHGPVSIVYNISGTVHIHHHHS